MEKQSQNVSAAPGAAETKEIEMDITLEGTKQYLKKDLSIAVSCLNAILSDPDLMDSTAQFMYGRYLNSKHKPKS